MKCIRIQLFFSLNDPFLSLKILIKKILIIIFIIYLLKQNKFWCIFKSEKVTNLNEHNIS